MTAHVKIVVVTGWRHWTEPLAVHLLLDFLYAKHGPFTLFHGACEDKRTGAMVGADLFADNWGKRTPGVTVEPFPAAWDRFGYDAGPKRNRDMVGKAVTAVGSDHVRGLAFPGPRSRGTLNAMKIMREFRIEYDEWNIAQATALVERLREYRRVLSA